MTLRISTPATQRIKHFANRLGLTIGRRLNTLAGVREAILDSGEIDLLLDVGAHAGEYAREVRSGGYTGRIISFEPIEAHFAKLLTESRDDSNWDCYRYGLGAEAGEAMINVSGNDGFSSSLLEIDSAHIAAVAASMTVRTEVVAVDRLDRFVQETSNEGRFYLKVDTQGYESEVLTGGSQTLKRCRGVELELSLRPLYSGQVLIGEMLQKMRGLGFAPTHLNPEFIDPNSGELLQVNVLFQPIEHSVPDPLPE